VKNAERFRQNPQFVDDAIATIAHSVTRMKRLMEQLASRSKEPVRQPTDLAETLRQAVERSRTRQPVPELAVDCPPMTVYADAERLTGVFEHLVRNAQDATEKDGRITVGLDLEDGVARVTIADTGCGMTAEFIRQRLFRPFDSTKGSEAMGIGAYQAREYVRALGGQLDISSRTGAGTTWSIRLPVGGVGPA
jgi:putative PEP-CTERM system histidine kinase